MAMPPTNDAVGEVDVADQRVADLVIACPGEDERRNQRAAARRARKRAQRELRRRRRVHRRQREQDRQVAGPPAGITVPSAR